jgi:hypothetical protein
MLLDNWDAVAAGVATYARENLSAQPRGAVSIRYPAAGLVFVGLFGNDDYAGEERARREVDLLRERLREQGLEVLGFGVGEGGRGWALLVKARGPDTEASL